MQFRFFEDPLPGNDAREHTTTASDLPLAARMDSCGSYRMGPLYFVEREGMESALLLLTTQGAGCIEAVACDGTKASFEAGPGTAVLLDCRREHRYATAPGGDGTWEFLWVHFRGDFVQPIVDLCSGHPISLSAAPRERMARRLTEIFRLCGGISAQVDLHVAGLIYALLAQLVEADAQGEPAGERDAPPSESGIPDAVFQAVRIFRAEFAERLTVEGIAERIHVSVTHLARLFRKTYGVSPYRYLSVLRVNQAKRMLAVEGCGVEETARRCGYCTSSNFIREFRRIDGETPLRFLARRNR